MLTEFLLALIPATGGIAYGIAAKIHGERGYEIARQELDRDIEKKVETKLRVGVHEFEHHLRQEPGHICGQVCFAMMNLQNKMRDNPGTYKPPY